MARHKQIIVLYILPLLGVIISLLTHANTLASLILFWGIPSLLLSIWAPEKIFKTLIFVSISTIFLIALNIIFYFNHQWFVVSMYKFRILGLMALEDIPYFFLYVYFPVIHWEHFYDKKRIREHTWGKRMTKLTSVLIITSLAILGAWAWAPNLIQIPYFYFIGDIFLMIIPLTLELFAHPNFGFKFLRIGLYFAYVGILYELTAIYLGQWYYPSNEFIGWISIIGLRFPIEELFAWIILGAVAIISWYEYFDDDNQ